MVCSTLSDLRKQQMQMDNILVHLFIFFAPHRIYGWENGQLMQIGTNLMLYLLNTRLMLMIFCFRYKEATDYPDNCLSITSDGMAQHHNQLPYLVNQMGFAKSLPQHLQGILATVGAC